MFLLAGPMLSPQSAQVLQPMSSNNANNSNVDASNTKPTKTQLADVGATWSNSGINIDLDNLLTNSNKNAAAPSMNQLASNPTSPVNQPRISGYGGAPPMNHFNNLNMNMSMNNGQNANQPFFAAFK